MVPRRYGEVMGSLLVDQDAAAPPTRARDLGVDRLRGALVLLMVAGNYLGGIAWVPAQLKHAPDVGLTVADLVAPCFVVVIGLNLGPSFDRRRREHGVGAAYAHLAIRAVALIGIGAILSAGGTAVAGESSDWGVLQALGVAVLLATATVQTPTWARFAIGLLILAAYQLFLGGGAVPEVLGSAHGGLVGAVAWGALLILATAVADVRRAGRVPWVVCCAVLATAAVLAAVVLPVSKNRVSPAYVLVSLAISALVVLLVDLASRAADRPAGFLVWWGRNALVLYLAHLVLLGLVVLPPAPGWYAQAPPWLAALQLAVILGLLSWLAWGLNRRRVRLVL